MKSPKLIVSALTGCLLVGASSTAIAEQCDGVIADDVVDSIEVGAGETCILTGVRVTGSVDVNGAATLVMVENDVGGRLRARRTDLVYIANTRLTNGNLVVRGSGVVYVLDNDTKNGSYRINGNTEATVNRNDSAGDLICKGNGDLISLLNAVEGNEDCRR